MSTKTVTVEIFPDGSSSIDLVGFHGKGCQKTLADFAGSDKTKLVVKKREFHEQEQQSVQVRTGGKT